LVLFEFGDIVNNESVYYLTPGGIANVTEGENATGIIPFATVQGVGTIEISSYLANHK